MSDLGVYSFLPWLRQGLANRIQSADLDGSVRTRVQVTVPVTVRGTKLSGGDETATITRSVALFGPGDIIGLDTRAIVRVEPRDWITNFEPNHLAHIEFYDEDFPWRYTPAAPDEAIDFPTESGAREYMRRRIAEDAKLADALHVIPTVERAA